MQTHNEYFHGFYILKILDFPWIILLDFNTHARIKANQNNQRKQTKPENVLIGISIFAMSAPLSESSRHHVTDVK